MKTKLFLISCLFSANAMAWTPWAASCADFWGRQVPEAARTPSNCPAHFRTNEPAAYGSPITKGSSSTTVGGSFIGSPSLPTNILLPSGNYVVVPNYSTGGISAVIQTSR
jgi:hypothetical protein